MTGLVEDIGRGGGRTRPTPLNGEQIVGVWAGGGPIGDRVGRARTRAATALIGDATCR